MNAVTELLTAHLRDLRRLIADANSRADAIERQIAKLEEQFAKGPAEPVNRRKEDGWSDEEDAILREHFPSIGAPGVAKLLPHRTPMAIRTRASKKGIKRDYGTGRIWCQQCEQRVTGSQIEACDSTFCKAKDAVA